MHQVAHLRQAAPFLRWAGGKRRLLPAILDKFPPDDELDDWQYVEPFLGGATVFFAMAGKVGGGAILGDENRHLINAYTRVASNVEEVIELLEANFDEYNRKRKPGRTRIYQAVRDRFNESDNHDVQQAADFIFLNAAGFNGIFRTNKRGEYNVPIGSCNKRLNLDKARLRAAGRALRGATVVAGGFERTLDKIATHKPSIVYLDPPYTVKHDNNGFIEYNQNLFEWSHQEDLADRAAQLARQGHRVIISNAAHNDIEALYPEDVFNHEYVERASTIGSTIESRGRARELVIWNGGDG